MKKINEELDRILNEATAIETEFKSIILPGSVSPKDIHKKYPEVQFTTERYKTKEEAQDWIYYFGKPGTLYALKIGYNEKWLIGGFLRFDESLNDRFIWEQTITGLKTIHRNLVGFIDYKYYDNGKVHLSVVDTDKNKYIKELKYDSNVPEEKMMKDVENIIIKELAKNESLNEDVLEPFADYVAKRILDKVELSNKNIDIIDRDDTYDIVRSGEYDENDNYGFTLYCDEDFNEDPDRNTITITGYDIVLSYEQGEYKSYKYNNEGKRYNAKYYTKEEMDELIDNIAKYIIDSVDEDFDESLNEGFDTYVVQYQLFNNKDQLITKQKEFKTKQARTKWIEKQEKDNSAWNGVLAISDPSYNESFQKNEARIIGRRDIDFENIGCGFTIESASSKDNKVALALDGYSNNTETDNVFVSDDVLYQGSPEERKALNNKIVVIKQEIQKELLTLAAEFDSKVMQIMNKYGFRK